MSLVLHMQHLLFRSLQLVLQVLVLLTQKGTLGHNVHVVSFKLYIVSIQELPKLYGAACEAPCQICLLLKMMCERLLES